MRFPHFYSNLDPVFPQSWGFNLNILSWWSQNFSRDERSPPFPLSPCFLFYSCIYRCSEQYKSEHEYSHNLVTFANLLPAFSQTLGLPEEVRVSTKLWDCWRALQQHTEIIPETDSCASRRDSGTYKRFCMLPLFILPTQPQWEFCLEAEFAVFLDLKLTEPLTFFNPKVSNSSITGQIWHKCHFGGTSHPCHKI